MSRSRSSYNLSSRAKILRGLETTPLAPYTDPDLWEGLLLLGLAPVVRHFKLYEKFKSFTGFVINDKIIDIYIPKVNWTLYQGISIAGLIAFSLIMVFFTDFTTGTNVVLLRVATGSVAPEIRNGAGHYFVWVALFVVYVRYGAVDIVRGVFTMGFFGALHEDPWYVAYLYVRPDTLGNILWYYSPFTILTLALIVFYIINFRWSVIPKQKILKALLFVGVYYTLWVAIGFPITIDNVTGNTPWYYFLQTNFIEDLSWMGLMMTIL